MDLKPGFTMEIGCSMNCPSYNLRMNCLAEIHDDSASADHFSNPPHAAVTILFACLLAGTCHSNRLIRRYCNPVNEPLTLILLLQLLLLLLPPPPAQC